MTMQIYSRGFGDFFLSPPNKVDMHVQEDVQHRAQPDSHAGLAEALVRFFQIRWMCMGRHLTLSTA